MSYNTDEIIHYRAHPFLTLKSDLARNSNPGPSACKTDVITTTLKDYHYRRDYHYPFLTLKLRLQGE